MFDIELDLSSFEVPCDPIKDFCRTVYYILCGHQQPVLYCIFSVMDTERFRQTV